VLNYQYLEAKYGSLPSTSPLLPSQVSSGKDNYLDSCWIHLNLTNVNRRRICAHLCWMRIRFRFSGYFLVSMLHWFSI